MKQRTDSPTPSYPTDLERFLVFFAEMDISDGYVAAAKRAKLRVLKRFTERVAGSGALREGFVVEAAFERRPVIDDSTSVALCNEVSGRVSW